MISAVGYDFGRPIDVATLLSINGSPGGHVADGDWILVWVFYPNTMTWTFAAPSGWTLLRATTGLLFPPRTVELWCRQWHTGDPTSWTINVTGVSGLDPDKVLYMVFRGLAAAPTVVSATHEGSLSPAIAEEITDASIGAADLQFCCYATKGGGFSIGTADSVNLSASPGTAIQWLPTGTAGFAAEMSAVVFGTTANTFGLQVILPSTAGGWGVGMVRMGGA